MKNVIALLPIIAIAAIVGCTPQSPFPTPPFVAQIYYQTTDGSDLFNSGTTGAYDTSDIKIYDLKTLSNGSISKTSSEIFVYSGNCQRYFCGPDDNGKYYLQYGVRTTVNTLGAVIQFSSARSDTLLYQLLLVNGTWYEVMGFTLHGKTVWSRQSTSTNYYHRAVILSV